MIKNKETMGNSMEQADTKHKKILTEMKTSKKKFDSETQKLEENHNKALCKLKFKNFN